MLREYASGPEFDAAKLRDELNRSANGAAWKRFGYLIELLRPEQGSLVASAHRSLTAGNIKLDPAIRTKGRLLRCWRLWVNAGLTSNSDEA